MLLMQWEWTYLASFLACYYCQLALCLQQTGQLGFKGQPWTRGLAIARCNDRSSASTVAAAKVDYL
jgi:hypothetical protein